MSSIITIDTLRESEKQAIGRLLVESYSQFQYAYEKQSDWLAYAEDLANSVNNPFVDRFLVARDENEVLGTVQLFRNSETAYNNPDLKIFSPIIRMLAVSPLARGKGIAQALLKESMNYAREQGADCIYLHTSDKMAEAIRLYEWLGFMRDPSKEFRKLNFRVKCYRLEL